MNALTHSTLTVFPLFSSCDTIDKLRAKLPSLEKEISSDPARFKDFYLFTFVYGKDPGQKSLDLDAAIAYWNIVFKGRFRFLDLWCKFLKVSKVKRPLDFAHMLPFACKE